MLKKLLTKSLLVVAGMLVGSSAWGVDYTPTVTGIVGAVDNSSGFNTKGNKQMSLEAGDEYVITFINYNKGASGTNYWANWAFISNVFNCRADHGQSNPSWGSATNVSYTGSSWTNISETITDWLQAYNGVTVTLTVSRDAAGTGLTVSHTATTNAVGSIASQTYAGTYTATVGASAEINFYLTVENAHLNITNVVYTNASGVETNYVLRDCVSSITAVGTKTYGTDGSGNSSTIRLNSYAAEGGAGAFAFTLDEDWDVSKVISATLSFYPISKCDNSRRNGDIYIRQLDAYPTPSSTYTSYSDGNHIVYSYGGSTTKRYAFSTTTLATISANGANTTVPAKGAYYGVDLTSHIQSLTTKSAGDNVYFGIDISDWAADITMGAYGNDYAPKLEIAYTSATLYTATFTETNSLDPTVTIYSDAGMNSEVTNGTLENGTTYYYKAVLYGYNDVTGNFTVSGDNPSINITMTAKEQYNYSLKYKLGTADAVEQASGTKYVDETVTIYYPVCRKDASENYYVVSKNNAEPNFGVVISSTNKDVTVNYTLDESIIYYAESENMAGSRYTASSQAATRTSNGASWCSAASENSYIATNWTVAADGNYDIEVGMANRGYSVSPAPQLKSGAEAVATATLGAISLSSNSYTIKEYKNQPINAGDQLYFYNDNGGNASKWALDYVILRNSPATVTKTITDAGYATFSSPYNLDFTGLDVKAYKASLDGSNTVLLTPVTQVPAGAGVLLAGAAGDYNIPVIASAAALEGNLLKASADAAIAASTVDIYHYVLANSTDYGTGFYNLAAAVNIGAGKAYLETTTALASANNVNARLAWKFADDVTAIKGVESKKAENGVMYNLAGQRVGKDYKGIVIVNGKKFMNN